MESFLHPTKRQRLAVVGSSLRRVFDDVDTPFPDEFVDYLRRIEENERKRMQREKGT